MYCKQPCQDSIKLIKHDYIIIIWTCNIKKKFFTNYVQQKHLNFFLADIHISKNKIMELQLSNCTILEISNNIPKEEFVWRWHAPTAIAPAESQNHQIYCEETIIYKPLEIQSRIRLLLYKNWNYPSNHKVSASLHLFYKSFYHLEGINNKPKW